MKSPPHTIDGVKYPRVQNGCSSHAGKIIPEISLEGLPVELKSTMYDFYPLSITFLLGYENVLRMEDLSACFLPSWKHSETPLTPYNSSEEKKKLIS